MKKNLTEIVFILDESGSMHNLTEDTIGGFNSLIKKQKNEEGEAIVSTVMFSSNSRVVHDRVSLECINEITEEDYCPGGSTALLDAVGGAIKHIGNIHKYAREEDVPEHTIFIITTDGMENASRNYDRKKVKKLIENQKEKYGWEFIFLGANIDAAETAADIGIDRETAVDYMADSVGTHTLFCSVASAVTNARMGIKNSKSSAWRADIDRDHTDRSGRR